MFHNSAYQMLHVASRVNLINIDSFLNKCTHKIPHKNSNDEQTYKTCMQDNSQNYFYYLHEEQRQQLLTLPAGVQQRKYLGRGFRNRLMRTAVPSSASADTSIRPF